MQLFFCNMCQDFSVSTDCGKESTRLLLKRLQKAPRIRSQPKVLGAFWYFVSIQRETTCWQLACKNDIGCSKTSPSFNCGDGFGNYTFLNDSCSLETRNTPFFDFGIFQEARQSGILASKDFFRKTIYCFWWGLRNLSSFGQNLETSSDYWENYFTILISIFGKVLFLYFIRNLQVYMQWETSKEMEELPGDKHNVTASKEMKETSKEKEMKEI
ncbi:hypothetical protein I3843_06G009300 [Carya illinoinensis]|nr:hypothetical protein I3843_06G009300 [Carya illinoinensis]